MFTLSHKKHGIMIDFIKKAPKWPNLLKSDSAYLKSFNEAILNFERNVMEEKDMPASKSKKYGFRQGSRL